MKYIDSIRRAGRSLGTAKGRTILTSLAIAVGAFTITLALAVGTGVREIATDFLNSNVNPRSVMVSKKVDMSQQMKGGGIAEYEENPDQTSGVNQALEFTITQAQVDKIKALDEVESVNVGRQIEPKYVSLESSQQKYTLSAVSYDAGILMKEVDGQLPELGEPLPEKSVVVSEELAKKLSDNGHVVGSTLQVAAFNPVDQKSKVFDYNIVAVAKPETFSVVAGNLFMSEDAAKDVYDFSTKGTEMFQRYFQALVITDDDFQPEQAMKAIEKIDDDLDAQTAEEASSMIFKAVNIAMYVIIGFGVISLIAAAFGIINTQYISVLGRTREIGLMKALGMRGAHVRRLFQLEAAWIGALGGIIGALLALVTGTLLNPWLSDSLDLKDYDLLVFEALPIVGLVFLLTLLAMVAGWFPARKAAKLDPIEALRTE